MSGDGSNTLDQTLSLWRCAVHELLCTTCTVKTDRISISDEAREGSFDGGDLGVPGNDLHTICVRGGFCPTLWKTSLSARTLRSERTRLTLKYPLWMPSCINRQSQVALVIVLWCSSGQDNYSFFILQPNKVAFRGLGRDPRLTSGRWSSFLESNVRLFPDETEREERSQGVLQNHSCSTTGNSFCNNVLWFLVLKVHPGAVPALADHDIFLSSSGPGTLWSTCVAQWNNVTLHCNT